MKSNVIRFPNSVVRFHVHSIRPPSPDIGEEITDSERETVPGQFSVTETKSGTIRSLFWCFTTQFLHYIYMSNNFGFSISTAYCNYQYRVEEEIQKYCKYSHRDK